MLWYKTNFDKMVVGKIPVSSTTDSMSKLNLNYSQYDLKWPFLLLTGFVFLIYSNTFQSPWILDDFNNILLNPSVRLENLDGESLWKAIQASLDGGRLDRPLARLTFALNWYFGGRETWGYHLLNISIHALCAFFLFLTVRALHRTPRGGRGGLDSICGEPHCGLYLGGQPDPNPGRHLYRSAHGRLGRSFLHRGPVLFHPGQIERYDAQAIRVVVWMPRQFSAGSRIQRKCRALAPRIGSGGNGILPTRPAAAPGPALVAGAGRFGCERDRPHGCFLFHKRRHAFALQLRFEILHPVGAPADSAPGSPALSQPAFLSRAVSAFDRARHRPVDLRLPSVVNAAEHLGCCPFDRPGDKELQILALLQLWRFVFLSQPSHRVLHHSAGACLRASQLYSVHVSFRAGGERFMRHAGLLPTATADACIRFSQPSSCC